MKRLILFLGLFFLIGASQANPFLTSASTTATAAPTHCGITMDTGAKIQVAVVKDSSGYPYCKYDLSSVPAGVHSTTVSYIIVDPVWGTLEGPTASINFTRPVNPAAPTGLSISP